MLLEREREVETLDAFVSGARRPGARLGLIEGPPGIGKTSLLAEARRLAESDGILVLSARGSELEREFPYGVVRQLFEPSLADPERRERALAGAAEPARAVFEAPGEAGAQLTGLAGLHALYWLALNLAGDEPLALAIDDLHWVDGPSLRFIAYLLRRLEDAPLLVAAAVRPHEPGADEALLAELAGDPLTVALHPGPLSAGGVGELLAERLGEAADEAFAGACHEATGGNPLLLTELVRALGAEGVRPSAESVAFVSELGPRSASRAVLLRLARLPGEAATVARAVAVLGDGAELWAVAALAGLDEEAAARATGALARAEVLRAEPPLGFVHPLVRDAVYLELSPGERELAHARAATLLHEAGAPAEAVAAQVLAAPGVEGGWVVETLETAARAARSRGALENAVPYLRRELEEPLDDERRARVLRELGRAEVHTSGPDAIAHLREAYARLEPPGQRSDAAMALAWTLTMTGDHEEAGQFAAGAAAELGEDEPEMRRGLEALELFSAYFGAGDHEPLARLEPWREPAAIEGPGSAMLAAGAAYDWANLIGPRERCVAAARRALAERELFDYDQGLFWCGAALVLVYAEEPDGLEIWDRVQRRVFRDESLFAILTTSLWGGYTALRWGQLDEAWQRLAAAEAEGRLWGAGDRIDHVPPAFIAELLLERGRVAEARGAIAATTSPIVPGSFPGCLWRRAEAEVLLAEGRPQEALEATDLLREALGRMVNPAAHPWRTVRAEALIRLGREDEAAALAAEELELARRWGAPGPIGRALRVLGAAEGPDGLDHLAEAVATLETSEHRLELAKALAALGTATRLARRPSDAREPLHRALELGSACGATALAERARAELGAAGARPRRAALSGVGALTPSERRVADLAAAGRTNREIAQELYVTPKTVEVHLSNTYRKLEIGGRRELSAALAG